MSEFHGGFLIPRVDPAVAEPVRLAALDYFRDQGLSVAAHQLTFAARRGCPLLHVAIRGGDADGKGYCYFNREHAELGARIAQRTGETCHAYSYENQVGTESLAEYAADGSCRSQTFVEWDDVDDSERPLALLAAELEIGSSLLENDLAYDTPSVKIALDAADAEATLARYLANLAPLDDANLETSLDRATFYFPDSMARDAGAIAERLGLPLGSVFWAAWEIGKHEIAASCSEACELGPPDPPKQIAIPESAPPAPAIEGSTDKIGLVLALPSRVQRELRAVGFAADRSLSWCLQKAWMLGRARLFAATKKTSFEREASQSFYFDEAVLDDVYALAAKLGLSFERLLTLAWELGKTEAFADHGGKAPPVIAQRELELPAQAPALPEIPASGEKVRISALLPERVLEELRECASVADRSLSWALNRAYRSSRSALHTATRR